MVETVSVKNLYSRLNEANNMLKNAKNTEERIALANYIGNIYSSINSVCKNKTIRPNKKKIFGSQKNYQKFIKKLNIYEYRMLENFVLKKDFHSSYLGDILSGVEEEIGWIEMDEKQEETTILSKDNFYEIFFEFMKSMQLEDLFSHITKEDRIYKTIRKSKENLLGFTLCNPINKEVDIFIGNFDYDMDSMFTLAHEMGHVYDLSKFREDTESYNRYFYQSFYGETISKLFERLLLKYLLKEDILVEEAKDKLLESEIINHDYLLGAYILSLLKEKDFENASYMNLSREELIKKVKDKFVSEENIRDYIMGSTYFDVSEDYNYAYGDILSMFLKESVEKYGFSNTMIEDFFEIRSELFEETFLKEWGLSPDKYLESYKKEIQLLKK